jgi:TPP-dependent pyruvate/acetoin dehydrogenase alpha subunit
MFKTMLLIREFEEVAHRMLMDGLVHGSMHQSIGQEAISVGRCGNLGQLQASAGREQPVMIGKVAGCCH